MAVMTYDLRLIVSSAAVAGLLVRLVTTSCTVRELCRLARSWSLMLRPALFLARVCYERQLLVHRLRTLLWATFLYLLKSCLCRCGLRVMLSLRRLVTVRVARRVWKRLDDMMITCWSVVGVLPTLPRLVRHVFLHVGRVSLLPRLVTRVIPV